MSPGLLSVFGRRAINIPPSGVLMLTYLLLIAVGTMLLMLPAATHGGISWSDAVFTATSAVTVTGLVVVETGGDFTLLGQALILLLIQLGGLGIVTFAVLILSMLGLPVGLSQRIYLRNELNQTSMSDLLRMALVILRVVILFELAGMAALAFVFVPEFGWLEGLWQSLFHSVSAFNNAGFGLFPDSFVRWGGHPVINIVVPLLIVVGGIGFSVLTDLYHHRTWRKFSLHTRLMLVGSAALAAWSIATFALLEWNNPETLGQFAATTDRFMASVFQALTTRTAGFNTVDMADLEDSSTLMFILLMFIGGGSASTAGGIKVTTFLVMLLATAAFLRRRSDPVAFHRSLGHAEIMKVLALVSLSAFAVTAATFLLSLTNDLDFLDLLFEAVSAFGTVGLSRGITDELNQAGRAVIVILMFIGRVGPLALGLFMATRVPPSVRYPAGRIFLG
ncbi:MAG: Ktr system potassium transporter B [Xanthomonadales bacterium]|nr:Ktr system potassium transporter B [Xanthomonadales bacterium]